MLTCILIVMLVSSALGIYGYFKITTQIRFIKNGNEDNFCSFEKARLNAITDNEQIHKQFHMFYQHLEGGIISPLTAKLDVLASMITSIPTMEEHVSALISRLPDRAFIQGQNEPLAERVKHIDEGVKDLGQQLNMIDQFVAKVRPLDVLMKEVVSNSDVNKKTSEDVKDLELEVYNLSENTKSVLVAMSKLDARVKAQQASLLDLLTQSKKPVQKPESLNDLALSVNQIKKELSNTASSLVAAIGTSEHTLKRELAKPVPLAMTEQTERRLIDTFIKINKILLKQEDPKKVTEVKKESEKAKPESKKPEKGKNSKVTPEIVQKIKALRAKGISYLKIGKKLSLSQATVYKVINS